MDRNDVEIVDKTPSYEGFFRIDRYRLKHRLFAGGWSRVVQREVFERGHAAAVLPYNADRDEVALIEQFRIGALESPRGPWLIEIVAGVIDAQESAEQVVRREAIEEAGCELHSLIPICDYLVSPGGTSERIALFCGQVTSEVLEGFHGLEEEHEDIRVFSVPFRRAMEMVADGRIDSASPIIALQWLALNRERIRRLWRE